MHSQCVVGIAVDSVEAMYLENTVIFFNNACLPVERGFIWILEGLLLPTTESSSGPRSTIS